MEAFLLLPVALLLFALLRPGEILSARTWGALAAMALLQTAHALHTLFVRKEYDPAMGEGIGFAARHFLPNLKTNLFFFVDRERFPPLLTALAAIGALRFRHARQVLPLAIWFMGFWGVFLFYYLGSYYFNTEERYALVALAPFALLAGAGFEAIEEAALRRGLSAGEFLAAVAAVLGLVFLAYVPRMSTIEPHTKQSQAEHRFIAATLRELPPDSIVLNCLPPVFLAMGCSSVTPGTALQNSDWFEGMAAARNSRVYVYHGLQDQEPDSPAEPACMEVLRRYEFRIFRERREGPARLVFYEIDVPPGTLDTPKDPR